MAPRGPKDKFSQKAYILLTLSGANTLTGNNLSSSAGTFEKIAWNIHRVEYEFARPSVEAMTADTDFLRACIARDSALSAITPSDEAIFDIAILHRADMGSTPADKAIMSLPQVIRDYTGLPGGGRLFPADSIYLWGDSQGLAGAMVVSVNIHYTIVKLKPDEYWQLVESMKLIR